MFQVSVGETECVHKSAVPSTRRRRVAEGDSRSEARRPSEGTREGRKPERILFLPRWPERNETSRALQSSEIRVIHTIGLQVIHLSRRV